MSLAAIRPYNDEDPVNSTSYPQRDGKWIVAYELRGEGLV